MRLVPIEFVKPGQYLAKTIFDDDGRILLRDGIKLTPNLIRRVKEMQIFSLYIIDEYSQTELEDMVKPELRQKAIKSLKETFFSMDKFSSLPTEKLSPAMIKERESYFSSIYDIAEELIDEILSRENLMINLVDIKSMDSYTYQHSVNVAILSLILGMQLQLPKTELKELCVGALVHDIGKGLIPQEILLKPGPLTDSEFSIMKEHVTRGYQYLRGILDISAKSRIVALQHHEKFNGTGYPEGRKGNEINNLARIVAIADVYDALTSDRPYRRALSPNESIEYIMANCSTHFDYEMVKAFSKAIVPYPKGTLVRLSNGDIGLVEETLPNFPLRPTVKIIKSHGDFQNGDIVKLVENLSIVIESIEYEV